MNRQTGDTIFTIGHSTRTLAEFVALLRQVDVTRLVDVRSLPWSRMTPQFNTDTCLERLPQRVSVTGILARSADDVIIAKARRPRSICTGAWRRSGITPTTQRPTNSAPGCKRCASWRAMIDAPSCAPKRSGGAVIAGSSDYLLAGGTRVEHIWVRVKSSRRRSRRVRAFLADGTLRYPAPDGAEATMSDD